jgi:hypothetical protein
MRRFIRTVPPPARLVVYQDDRERQGLLLPDTKFVTITRRLLTGDYSFKGLESVVAIEKKSGLGEICSDLSGKSRARFLRFLGRMSRYPVKIMLICSSGPNEVYALPDYRGSATPLSKTSNYWLSKINMEYGIATLFVGSPLNEELVVNIFQDAWTAGQKYLTRGGRP